LQKKEMIMTTTTEYALLSLYVYDVKNKPGNRPLLPKSWEKVALSPDDALGFSYGIFKNTATNEVVIAYTGTNEKMIADWASNITAGTGTLSPQVIEAAKVFLDTRKWAGNNITTTGHSLGGGLASIMAVWFNCPAVVFDEAPFQPTATSATLIATAATSLAALGYVNTGIAGAISDFAARESQVSNYYLAGEVLNMLRFGWNTVVGAVDEVIPINGAKTSGINLHSQALLAMKLGANTSSAESQKEHAYSMRLAA
jgi:hypothetical protein